MKKRTFLQRLKKQIVGQSEEEVLEIVTEYGQYIDDRIKKGLTEEEAVATFGSVDELAELLSKKEKKQELDPIGDAANKIIRKMERIIKNISKKTIKEITTIILELFIFILLIIVLHFPVSLLIELGKDLFYILTNPLNRICFTAWKFILEFTYYIFAIIMFLKALDRYDTEEEKELEWKDKRNKQVNVSKIIVNSLVFFVKFLSILILLGISIYLIMMGGILLFCLYLFVKGVTYYGFYVAMIALFLLGIVIFHILYSFVLDNNNHSIHYLIWILCCFFILIAGCSIAALEIAETDYINHPPANVSTEILREELTMNKDTIFIGNISDYIIDNKESNIIVEFHYYPLGNRMSTNISKNDNEVYLNWNQQSIYFQKDVIQNIIENLKEKKVYNYYFEPYITITSNEQNISIIKKNRLKYYQEEKDYSSCNFIRTYYVEMIKNNVDSDTKTGFVILSEYGVEELATVELPKRLITDLEVGNYYEFTFKSYQSYIDISLENIFKENEVESVRLVNRNPEEQTRETTCSIFY